MEFRRATVEDLPQLAAIAWVAKASWGYPRAALEQWREELSLTADQLDAWIVTVATDGERILGFAALVLGHGTAELEHLWVSPAAMGRGVGRALVRESCAAAAVAGTEAVLIDSDPNAEPFYRRLGAVRIGSRAAPLPDAPDRVRPRLRLSLDAG